MVEAFCKMLGVTLNYLYPNDETILHRIVAVMSKDKANNFLQPLKPNTINWLIAEQKINPMQEEKYKKIPAADFLEWGIALNSLLDVAYIAEFYTPEMKELELLVAVNTKVVYELFQQIYRLRAMKLPVQTTRLKRSREEEEVNEEIPVAKRPATAKVNVDASEESDSSNDYSSSPRPQL